MGRDTGSGKGRGHEQGRAVGPPLALPSRALVWPSASLTSPLLFCQVSRLESFWALRVVCPEQLTALLAWIREPWEQLFSIGLRTVTQETLDLDL